MAFLDAMATLEGGRGGSLADPLPTPLRQKCALKSVTNLQHTQPLFVPELLHDEHCLGNIKSIEHDGQGDML